MSKAFIAAELLPLLQLTPVTTSPGLPYRRIFATNSSNMLVFCMVLKDVEALMNQDLIFCGGIKIRIKFQIFQFYLYAKAAHRNTYQ